MKVFEGTPGNKVDLAELFKGKKGVLFGVPGAFTPGCSKVRPGPLCCPEILPQPPSKEERGGDVEEQDFAVKSSGACRSSLAGWTWEPKAESYP